MTELAFNATIIIAFILVCIIVTVGFSYFLKWRRNVITTKPSHDDLAKRAAEIDAKFRKTHPDVDEPSDD